MFSGVGLFSYFRTHRGVSFLITLVVSTTILALLLNSGFALDNLFGSAGTPISQAVVAGMGILGAMTWTSCGNSHEDILLGDFPTKVRLLHFPAVLLVITAATTIGTCLVQTVDGTLVIYVRSAILWTSIAFAGAAVWSSRSSWILPIVYLLTILAVGHRFDGTPFVWNLPALAPNDVWSWVATGLITAAAFGLVVRAAR